MQRTSLLLTLATAVLLIGCGNSNMSLPTALTDSANIDSKASDSPKEESSSKDEPIEFNGVTKMKSELSEETLKWLDWYSTLPEENRNALSFIPSEFINSRGRYPFRAAVVPESSGQAQGVRLTYIYGGGAGGTGMDYRND